MDERALSELLECSVCLDRLDTTSKVLPCQHTFCRRCLEEIKSTKNELRCPECRTLVQIPIEELPGNILLIRLLEGIKNAARSGSSSCASPSSRGSSSPASPSHGPGPGGGPNGSSPIHKTSPTSHPCAKALYNYDAKEQGDLTFKKGDIILLRKQVDDNWYHGELNGHHGFFPATYVQVITALPQEIPKEVPKCKALYDFIISDQNEKDCLTFHKDEILTVIRRIDGNWAEGKLGERIGIFPISFVEMNDSAKFLINSHSSQQQHSDGTHTTQYRCHPVPSTSAAILSSQTSQVTSAASAAASAAAAPTPTPALGSTPQVPMAPSQAASSAFAGEGSASPIATMAPVAMAPASDVTASASLSTAVSLTSSQSPITSSRTSSSAAAPSSSSFMAAATTSSVTSSSLMHAAVVAVAHRSAAHKRHSLTSVPPTRLLGPQSPADPHHQRHSMDVTNLPVTVAMATGAFATLATPSVGGGATQAAAPVIAARGGSQMTASAESTPRDNGRSGGGGSKAPLFVYVSLYNYKPQKEDEIELKKGEYYSVVEKCQDGWFKGMCLRTGAFGVFPGNYVQLVKFTPARINGSSGSRGSSAATAATSIGKTPAASANGVSGQAAPDMPAMTSSVVTSTTTAVTTSSPSAMTNGLNVNVTRVAQSHLNRTHSFPKTSPLACLDSHLRTQHRANVVSRLPNMTAPPARPITNVTQAQMRSTAHSSAAAMSKSLNATATAATATATTATLPAGGISAVASAHHHPHTHPHPNHHYHHSHQTALALADNQGKSHSLPPGVAPPNMTMSAMASLSSLVGSLTSSSRDRTCGRVGSAHSPRSVRRYALERGAAQGGGAKHGGAATVSRSHSHRVTSYSQGQGHGQDGKRDPRSSQGQPSNSSSEGCNGGKTNNNGASSAGGVVPMDTAKGWAPSVVVSVPGGSRAAEGGSSHTGQDKEKRREKEKERLPISLMKKLASAGIPIRVRKSKSPTAPSTGSGNHGHAAASAATATSPTSALPVPSQKTHKRSGSAPSEAGCCGVPVSTTTATGTTTVPSTGHQRHKSDSASGDTEAAASGAAVGVGVDAGRAGTTRAVESGSGAASGSATSARPGKVKPLPREKYRCIVPYPPQSDVELELKVGDMVYVHRKREDGWFRGTLLGVGKSGMFPGSFVEKC